MTILHPHGGRPECEVIGAGFHSKSAKELDARITGRREINERSRELVRFRCTESASGCEIRVSEIGIVSCPLSQRNIDIKIGVRVGLCPGDRQRFLLVDP
jgi:ssDNA-binding replication factor A large subunit